MGQVFSSTSNAAETPAELSPFLTMLVCLKRQGVVVPIDVRKILFTQCLKSRYSVLTIGEKTLPSVVSRWLLSEEGVWDGTVKEDFHSCAAHKDCVVTIPAVALQTRAKWHQWQVQHFQESTRHHSVPFDTFLSNSSSCQHSVERSGSHYASSAWGSVDYTYFACTKCGAITSVKVDVEA
jgi:hypothetical protein